MKELELDPVTLTHMTQSALIPIFMNSEQAERKIP